MSHGPDQEKNVLPSTGGKMLKSVSNFCVICLKPGKVGKLQKRRNA